jgi:hypothetical protein
MFMRKIEEHKMYLLIITDIAEGNILNAASPRPFNPLRAPAPP